MRIVLKVKEVLTMYLNATKTAGYVPIGESWAPTYFELIEELNYLF